MSLLGDKGLATLAFVVLPFIVCGLLSIFFILITIVWGKRTSTANVVERRRPILNLIFSKPLRFITNFLEVGDLTNEKSTFNGVIGSIQRAIKNKTEELDEESRAQGFENDKLASAILKKVLIFFDYFEMFLGDLVLLLLLLVAMRFLLPDLFEAFTSSFGAMGQHITEISTNNIGGAFARIGADIVGFFKYAISSFELSWQWIAFIAASLLCSIPIRLYIIPENTASTRFGYFCMVCKYIALKFVDGAWTSAISVNLMCVVFSFVIAVANSIGGFAFSSFDMIVQASAFFIGIYMIAAIVQFVIYVLDFIIGLFIVRPVVFLANLRKGN